MLTKRCACGRFLSAENAECAHCELFECAECRQLCRWELGCADDRPQTCDDCYSSGRAP